MTVLTTPAAPFFKKSSSFFGRNSFFDKPTKGFSAALCCSKEKTDTPGLNVSKVFSNNISLAFWTKGEDPFCCSSSQD